MNDQKIKQIVNNIKSAFLNEDRYQFIKEVKELYDKEEKFLGDFVSFLIVDKNTTPPLFYYVCSPYDVVSKKDPQQALVWKGGELLLNTDYTELAAMRTGAMDSIALKLSNINALMNQRILLFGTGKTAKWSLRILKAFFSDLNQIEYLNSKSTADHKFESFAKELGVKASVGSKEQISSYDIILCHTNAKEPVLNINDIKKIKSGAVITTYIGSTEHGEVADEFYTTNANVVLDWKSNLKVAKDILRSPISEKDIILLSDLLSEKSVLPETNSYTIFRFLGTPMQNLGVLQSMIS